MKGTTIKRLYYSALTYMALGLASGLYYRELTKAHDFEGFTQLAVAHTHLLALGMIFFLIVMGLEKLFAISQARSYRWFFWTYNSGLILTVAMLITHGTLTVLGTESNVAIAGIAGLGHMLLTAGLILLFAALKRSYTTEATAV